LTSGGEVGREEGKEEIRNIGGLDFGGSRKVLLGTAIPYYSMPCGQPTLGLPNGCLEVGRPKSESHLSVAEISISPCEGA
jgi:hypothetical protein